MTIKFKLGSHLKNIPGWRTGRKIMVFESDDWGGIRMPSLEVYADLRRQGVGVSNNEYKYDSLANSEDLQGLFHVLEGVRDSKGNHAVFTAVSNVANPDFERIRASDFKEYYYEGFTDTLARYYPGEQTFEMWKRGMEQGIFIPELHGREHLSVPIWMEKLKEGSRDLHLAFDRGVASVRIPGLHPAVSEFRPGYYFDAESQKVFLKESIPDAVSLFREIFACAPGTLVPGNAIFHPDFEQDVADAGIEFLNVERISNYPSPDGALKSKYYTSGRKNSFGTTYYIRNCAFEPVSEHYNGIESTLYQIAAAFRWGKPAFISTHRVNYIGALEPLNRIKGLHELETLLKAIVKRWPEVEFMNSVTALRTLRATRKV